MRETTAPAVAAPSDAATDGWLVCRLGNDRVALPATLVEAVAAPPPLALVPHAPTALLGAGNLAGQIVPIVDLAHVLGRKREGAAFDFSGEVVRLRLPEGSVGLRVDRVERLLGRDRRTAAAEDLGDVTALDPTALLAPHLTPPALAANPGMPLAEVPDSAIAALPEVAGEAFILVEVAGQTVWLRGDAVVALLETVSWTPVPRAPPGLRGVGVLRGTALPILSLAALLGHPEPVMPGGFALVDIAGQRVLLAADRIVGLDFVGRTADLRTAQPGLAPAPAAAGDALDLAGLMTDALRRIVRGFAAIASEPQPAQAADPVDLDQKLECLTFELFGQEFAVALAEVDRVVGAQPVIALPRPSDAAGDIAMVAGAIELRGRIIPIADLRAFLGLGASDDTPPPPLPAAYVILRGPEGLTALAADRVGQIERLSVAEIAAAPTENGLLDRIAVRPRGRLLRLLTAARLWDAA